jgi:hypothetical protein
MQIDLSVTMQVVPEHLACNSSSQQFNIAQNLRTAIHVKRSQNCCSPSCQQADLSFAALERGCGQCETPQATGLMLNPLVRN